MDGRRPGRGLWLAWGLALTGGISVLVAAVLVARTDAEGVCGRGFPCADALPASATTLAIVGTVLAVVGGLTATALAFRRLGPDGDDGHTTA